MYCSKCGEDNGEHPKFCKKCGSNFQNLKDNPKKTLNGKSVYSIAVSVLCIVLSGTLVWTYAIRGGNGNTGGALKDSMFGLLSKSSVNFSTPEAAIEHYTQKLAENDMWGALQACAIDEGRYYDFPEAVKNMGVFYFNNKWPGKYDLYKDINTMTLLGEYSQKTKMLVGSLLIPELEFTAPISQSTPEGKELIQDTKLLEKRLDPADLSSLQVKKIASDYIRDDYTKKLEENYKRNASYFGGKQIVERAVLYVCNENLFMGGFQLIEMENGWKIHDFSAPYFGSEWGALTPVTIEEWEKMIEKH